MALDASPDLDLLFDPKFNVSHRDKKGNLTLTHDVMLFLMTINVNDEHVSCEKNLPEILILDYQAYLLLFDFDNISEWFQTLWCSFVRDFQ